jgi:hypothetical protein
VATVRFTKSVIASRAALTYAEAQTRIDDERLHDEVTLGGSWRCTVGCFSDVPRCTQGHLWWLAPA